ncbi:MoaD/ThiS family protein [Hyphococcus sp.]|uniref:MoaD/ThiS family protein n=1 Tax=Hyphococcus sp. TaxID=2038636 RepID=UPI0020839A03|nr:MAG: molybdopterin synthase sulfur carrier subunit [Marinicaulis sp.]
MARLLFFGKLGDAAGQRERDWPIGDSGMTIDDIVAALGRADTWLGAELNAATVRCIVNEQMSARNVIVYDGDEIAFLPPVSGG